MQLLPATRLQWQAEDPFGLDLQMTDVIESQQAAGPAGAPELLQRELAAAMDEGLHVCAIIDPASFAQAWARFGSLACGREGGSLFVGTSHAQNPAVAPLLVPLKRSDSTLQHAIADVALESSAVVWLASTLPPADLAPTLTVKLDAELAEGRQAITLRYFDPRVLPELLRVLNARQQSHLNSGIRRWWWFDRRNELCSYEPVKVTQPVSQGTSTPIALDDDQVRTLLEASFVDRVLDVLTRSSPACLRPFDRAQRQEIAARHVDAAAQWGLTSEFDCASFIAVSLQQGPDFANSPAWASLMSSVKAGTLSFSDAIEQWESFNDDLA